MLESKVEWVEREEELSVICVNMVVRERVEIRMLRGVLGSVHEVE